jgi:hypothetical protein
LLRCATATSNKQTTQQNVMREVCLKPSTGRVEVEGKLAESETNLDKVIKEYG